MNRFRLWAVGLVIGPAFGGGCDPPQTRHVGQFDRLEAADLVINDHTLRTWIAKTDGHRRLGLMYVSANDLEPLPDGTPKGMVFLFKADRGIREGFWMKNVPIPLDIAFIDAEGTIVTIRAMAPHDHRTTHPTAPYRYAVEVKAGLYHRLGVKEGDLVQIPESILNNIE